MAPSPSARRRQRARATAARYSQLHGVGLRALLHDAGILHKQKEFVIISEFHGDQGGGNLNGEGLLDANSYGEQSGGNLRSENFHDVQNSGNLHSENSHGENLYGVTLYDANLHGGVYHDANFRSGGNLHGDNFHGTDSHDEQSGGNEQRGGNLHGGNSHGDNLYGELSGGSLHESDDDACSVDNEYEVESLGEDVSDGEFGNHAFAREYARWDRVYMDFHEFKAKFHPAWNMKNYIEMHAHSEKGGLHNPDREARILYIATNVPGSLLEADARLRFKPLSQHSDKLQVMQYTRSTSIVDVKRHVIVEQLLSLERSTLETTLRSVAGDATADKVLSLHSGDELKDLLHEVANCILKSV